MCPSDNRGRRESRVSDAPAASCAENNKTHELVTTGPPYQRRLSLRGGFNGFLRALSGDRALLPPSLRGSQRIEPGRAEWLPQNLTPASGRQDHTTSPSAKAPFVCAPPARSRTPHRSRPAIAAAPTLSRPSRPAFLTIANRPSEGRDRVDIAWFVISENQNIFEEGARY
jgi:hypothetical protein